MRQRISFVFIVAIVILAMVVVEATGEEAEPFSFRNGVTFGMSAGEIIAIESAQNFVDKDTWHTEMVHAWTSLNRGPEYDIKISQYTGCIEYLLLNNAMQVAYYDIATNGEDEVYQNITKALSSVYGDYEEVDSETISSVMWTIYPSYIDPGVSEARVWKRHNVIIYQFVDKYEHLTILYLNPAFDYANPPIDVTGL